MTAQGPDEYLESLSTSSVSEGESIRTSCSESSEEELTETSSDRAFVVSDNESWAYSESTSDLSGHCQYCQSRSEDGAFAGVGQKVPISAIAERVVNHDGDPVTEYLVLWQSWEQVRPDHRKVEDMQMPIESDQRDS